MVGLMSNKWILNNVNLLLLISLCSNSLRSSNNGSKANPRVSSHKSHVHDTSEHPWSESFFWPNCLRNLLSLVNVQFETVHCSKMSVGLEIFLNWHPTEPLLTSNGRSSVSSVLVKMLPHLQPNRRHTLISDRSNWRHLLISDRMSCFASIMLSQP